ncbi:MAG: hypothetical protein NT079_02650 [Candidatus Omnitrophica bacterium]|nr:hypothetical protein [Candidatus Omnitrophota bacterium]
MSKAAKQVIIFLGVLLLVCAIALWSMFSQKTVLQEANTQLQSEIAGNKKDLAVLGQKKEELITENNNLKNEISSVTNEKDQLGGKVSDLVAQVDSLESRANAITSERNEWKQKYEKVSKQRDDAVAKLQAAETEAKRATEGTIVLSGDPDKQAENHWAQVLKEKAELSLRIEKLETDLSQTALGIEELKKKNSDLGLEISALKQQKEELERQIKRRAEIADKISIDLVREKNDKQAIGDQLSKIREENLELRASVKELGAMKIVLD